jgi:predicted Zn-dependent peptidase
VSDVALPFTKRTLANGLDVIVHEDHHVPIVAVNVWYHVGSKNEHVGATGFAHLFEHLMFEGSEHHNAGYFPPIQQAGGLLNGSTNSDRTNYWEVVPTSALDRALWMESDRMAYLLPALTPERFETQRGVVLNDIETERAFDLAEAYFGECPPGPKPAPVFASVVPAGERRLLQEDRVELPRLYVAWHSPAMYAPFDAELDLAADVLANGKTSRLYR